MNERNVAALKALLDDWFDDPEGLPPLAEWLADHGVLVPSVLADEECMPFLPAYFRVELERIAKGGQ